MQTYQKALFSVLFILFGWGTALYAQTPNFTKAADYNDYIVLEQTLMGRKLESFNKALAEENMREAKKQHAELLSQIDLSIQKINNMPDFKGNTAFKNAAFELFVFYKMIISQDYQKIMTIVEREGANDKTFPRINSIFISIQRDEAVMFGQFNKAQNDFAKQFDMKIQENELEKERREKERTDTQTPK